MKLLIPALAILAMSCGNSTDKKQEDLNTDIQSDGVTEQELKTIDSITSELEAAREEIEASSAKLDSLIKAL